MGEQFLFGGVGAGAEHDERFDGLTPLGVGHTDDGGFGDGGVLDEGVFDLDRRDVLAAGDDDVLLAVGDGEVAVVVDPPAVTGVEPSVADDLGGVCGLLPVAAEDGVAAGEDLAVVV